MTRVVVVGGGIAGLTLAHALLARGIEVQVLERAPELHEVGAGLLVAANAMRVFSALGLGEALTRAGARLTRGVLAAPDGRELSVGDVERVERELREPSLGMHRGVFHGELARALPAGVVRLGAEVVDVEDRAVVLADGSRVGGDVIVGADGIRSRVRERLFGAEPLRAAGQSCWRGLVPVDAVPEGHPARREFVETWGRGARFGTIPLGGGWMSWHAYFRRWREPDVDPAAAREMLLAIFGGWHDPIRRVLEAADHGITLRTENVDRDPLTTWVRGRVVLLGDAAQPITPNIGQGAAMAVEAAWVLARELGQRPTVEDALAAYEAARKPRQERVLRVSRFVGRWASVGLPVAKHLRDLAMLATPAPVAWRTTLGVLDFPLGDA